MNNSSSWGAANATNQNNAGTQQWNNHANRPPVSSQSDGKSRDFFCLLTIIVNKITSDNNNNSTRIYLYACSLNTSYHSFTKTTQSYKIFYSQTCMMLLFLTANKNNANGQQPPTSQSNSSVWPQPGSKSSTGNSGPPTSTTSSNGNTQNNNAQNNTSSTTKQQLEQLNNMREAIFSQDGWGGVCTFHLC